jgi:hypothetical protein
MATPIIFVPAGAGSELVLLYFEGECSVIADFPENYAAVRVQAPVQ